MKKKQVVTFGGITAEAGTRAFGWYEIPNCGYRLPVTVLNGSREGNTVLITSAIHGCEYPSIEAVFELAETLDSESLSGQLVFVNPVNVTAFLERRPYILPEEGRNLNRLFPGNPKGQLGDQIAWALTEEFQKKADFHIDTHGGDIPEKQLSYVYYPGVADNPEVLRRSEEAAEYVLHADFVIRSHATNHAYTWAARVGTPSLELEGGDGGSWTADEVARYQENILNLLKYLKVYPGEPRKRTMPAIQITQAEYQDADASGRWYAFVGKEDTVRKGQKIGEIRDLFGVVLREYHAAYDGRVLMVVQSLGIKEGDPIFAYGR